MSQTLPVDKKAFVLKVEAGGSGMVAIKLKALARAQREDFEGDVLTETRDIRIFPRHLIVPAGKTKPVRVWVVNKNNTPYEKAYRIVAESVPIARDSKVSGVQVSLKYMASLYLVPNKTQKSANYLLVNSATLTDGHLVLNLANTGHYHKIMQLKKIHALDGDKQQLVDHEDALVNVLSQSKVNFKIPLTNEAYNVLKKSQRILFKNECKDCADNKDIVIDIN